MPKASLNCWMADASEDDGKQDMDADEASAGDDAASDASRARREDEPEDGAPPAAGAWTDALGEAWRLFCSATPEPDRTLGAWLGGLPADARKALKVSERHDRGKQAPRWAKTWGGGGDRKPPADRAGWGSGGKGRASGGGKGGKGGRSHGGGWDRNAEGSKWKGAKYGKKWSG